MDGTTYSWKDQETWMPGDTMEVVSSPYSSVPVGTVADISEVRFHHFGDGVHLYILKGLPHDRFRRSELKRIKVRPQRTTFAKRE